MTGSARLMVRIDKGLDGDTVQLAVPVRVRRVPSPGGDDAAGAARQAPVTVAAPATHEEAWAICRLPPGSYDVEAILPSGEIITDQADLADGEDRKLVLRGEPSPAEKRSWAHFSGARNIPISTLEAAACDEAGPGALQPVYGVSLGRETRLGGDRTAFGASSWEEWYRLLDRQWHARASGSAEEIRFEMEAQDPGLRLARHSGDGGAPLRVVVSAAPGAAPWSKDVGSDRSFLVISSARGTRMLSVPWPWRSDAPGKPDAGFFEVLVSETGGALRCEPVLRDEHVGGVLAYLNAGRVGLAGALLKGAYDMLFGKYDNPLGAAAGGYVLLSTAESQDLAHWPYWLGNLAEFFPHLPDGAILRARWLHERGRDADMKEAHRSIEQAFERGLPFFTAGVAWLIEGLRRTAIDCPLCEQRLRMVRGVARSMDLSRGVTSFSLPAPGQQGGAGPRRRGAAPTVHAVDLRTVEAAGMTEA